ncbi:MAG: hypothetical protein HYU99_00535 [Deltaproteobacteria bacterium]|nr:hypothetical protein [Deltaproteobacteria bacterium]
MMRQLFPFVLVFALFLGACSESGSSLSDEGESTSASSSASTGTGVDSLTYNASGFSTWLEFTPEKNYLRIAFSFFPDGTAFDFDKKTASIPCTFLSRIPEGVDVQLSAPVEEPCETPYTVTFDGAGETFTLNGIVAPFNTAYEKFAGDFEFDITAEGVRDVSDGASLSSDSGKLEDFYDLILERRTP